MNNFLKGLLVSISVLICIVILIGLIYKYSTPECSTQIIEKTVVFDSNHTIYTLEVARILSLRCDKQVEVVAPRCVTDCKYGFTTLSSNVSAECTYKMKQEVCK
jgi:hypothetical protein